jgi:uncharacterized damage-inducible protein DinB
MYISLVPDDGHVLDHLETNLQQVKDLVYSLPPDRLDTPHAEGEWTVKEILVHVIDDERIYAYRAMRFARNDMTELPGFEQDDYTPYTQANDRTLDDIFEEYTAVRQATLTLFKYLPDDAFMRAGIANGARTTVRAYAYHIAGHELHHLDSIREHYV